MSERIRAMILPKWRLTMKAKLIAVLPVLGMVAFAVPSSASAAKAGVTPCQRAAFFGAHGVNEGAAGTGPWKSHWGTAVQTVFRQFQDSLAAAHKPLPEGASVSYPRVNIASDTKSWVQSVEQDAGAVSAAAVAKYGSFQLELQLKKEHKACPDQAFVIAGYSQGAWVVDKALHVLQIDSKIPSLGAEALAILHQIKYVFLMGDPAYPAYLGVNCGPGGIVTSHCLGYSWDDYWNNGLSRGSFESMCFKADPICTSSVGINDETIKVHATWYFQKPVICDTGGGDLDNLTYPVARCGGSTMAGIVANIA
jgi:hypothetical protein